LRFIPSPLVFRPEYLSAEISSVQWWMSPAAFKRATALSRLKSPRKIKTHSSFGRSMSPAGHCQPSLQDIGDGGRLCVSSTRDSGQHVGGYEKTRRYRTRKTIATIALYSLVCDIRCTVSPIVSANGFAPIGHTLGFSISGNREIKRRILRDRSEGEMGESGQRD
jgi:hypothetical protein